MNREVASIRRVELARRLENEQGWWPDRAAAFTQEATLVEAIALTKALSEPQQEGLVLWLLEGEEYDDIATCLEPGELDTAVEALLKQAGRLDQDPAVAQVMEEYLRKPLREPQIMSALLKHVASNPAASDSELNLRKLAERLGVDRIPDPRGSLKKARAALGIYRDLDGLWVGNPEVYQNTCKELCVKPAPKAKWGLDATPSG